jgi:VanZ family protein
LAIGRSGANKHNSAMFQILWRFSFLAYFLLLSWQLLTPVTIVNAGGWDKLIHFSGFFVLAGLAMLAGWKTSSYKLVLALIGYAALTEILQYFIPGRSFSVLDWMADSLGVLIASLIFSLVSKRVPFFTKTGPEA